MSRYPCGHKKSWTCAWCSPHIESRDGRIETWKQSAGTDAWADDYVKPFGAGEYGFMPAHFKVDDS